MSRYIRCLTLGVILFVLIASASWADDYNAQQAGQPWKLLAYVLNPVGVTLDYVIARPLHCFLHLELVDKLTGHSLFAEKKEYIDTMY